MSALRLLMAVAVLLAAINCVSACVRFSPDLPSSDVAVPPCHRHPGPSHRGDAQPCPHQLTGTVQPHLPGVFPVAAVWLMPVLVPSSPAAVIGVRSDKPYPGPDSSNPSVLRI